jgi:signal transduction histidine kinase
VTPLSRRSSRDAAERAATPDQGDDGLGDLVHEYLESVAGPAFARAARFVATRAPVDIPLGDDGLGRHFRWIADAGTTGTVGGSDETGATVALRRRLIALLRSALIDDWARVAAGPDDMLRSLQLLERAQRACTASVDQAFAAELADQGGLDLVVEVAHDMRSPLTSILFLSEILHRGQSGSFNEAQKRQIGIIYSAALGLVGLASDMIELARGGSHLRARDPVPFSVNEVLRSVHDLVRPTAEEKNLDLHVNTLDSEHRIGHPIPLNRVLLNLTTNALKFTQKGSVELTATPAGGSRVHFAVRDTGPGITPDAMETLYQTFRREPGRETGYCFSGTGLGLSICRKLVHAMDAELQVETQPDEGTTFSFVIDLPPARML